MNKFLLYFALLLLAMCGTPQGQLLDQKIPQVLEYHEKDAQFYDIRELALDTQDVFLSQPVKILEYNDKVYVLDRKLCKILVLDPQGKYLYSVGRPGQGPGDLEYPLNFTISQDRIYILSSGARKIDLFSLNGNYEKRITIAPPNDDPFSYPSQVIVGKNNRILITYNLSSHLIDSYFENGDFEKTLLKREAPINVPGVNIGNSSFFQLVDQGESIIHFDYFSGVFTKLSLSGKILVQFSAFDAQHKREQDRILKEVQASAGKQMNPPLRIEVYELWADGYCIDESGDIIALLKITKKEVPKKLFVFSRDGIFKYCNSMPSYLEGPINRFYFSGGRYFFITQQNKIFTARRRSQ